MISYPFGVDGQKNFEKRGIISEEKKKSREGRN